MPSGNIGMTAIAERTTASGDAQRGPRSRPTDRSGRCRASRRTRSTSGANSIAVMSGRSGSSTNSIVSSTGVLDVAGERLRPPAGLRRTAGCRACRSWPAERPDIGDSVNSSASVPLTAATGSASATGPPASAGAPPASRTRHAVVGLRPEPSSMRTPSIGTPHAARVALDHLEPAVRVPSPRDEADLLEQHLGGVVVARDRASRRRSRQRRRLDACRSPGRSCRRSRSPSRC